MITKNDTRPVPGHPFVVVGIGASAGGLEALTALLSKLPINTGMAYVVVQHLSPTHESLLPAILAKATQIPVSQVNRNHLIKPDNIYIIAPNTVLELNAGFLKPSPRGSGHTDRVIDHFFKSLALEQGSASIGVILSGTGTDGTNGTKAIKAVEGLVIIQKPETARHDGMPISAMKTGCADHILSPEEIGLELKKFAENQILHGTMQTPAAALTADSAELHKLFSLLKASSGTDFSEYKESTVYRRIFRRLNLLKMGSFAEYLDYIEKKPAELNSLRSDILINYTKFFRDPALYEKLTDVVFPSIMKMKANQDILRFWVAGCSSGEDAYSLAIAFTEFLDKNGRTPSFQVIASDINEMLIEKARYGFFGKNIGADVPDELLRKYFTKQKDGYQVVNFIRNICVFARHDILEDPPFTRMDLVCCRNVLIYFGNRHQKTAFIRFHFALNPSGYLVLGTSESASSFAD